MGDQLALPVVLGAARRRRPDRTRQNIHPGRCFL